MNNKTKLRVLIICSVIFMGMSNKTDFLTTQNNYTTDCEKAISQCQQSVFFKQNLLSKLKAVYAKNPSEGLLKAIVFQNEQLKNLKIECTDRINDACSPVICPSCGSNILPGTGECPECGEHF